MAAVGLMTWGGNQRTVRAGPAVRPVRTARGVIISVRYGALGASRRAPLVRTLIITPAREAGGRGPYVRCVARGGVASVHVSVAHDVDHVTHVTVTHLGFRGRGRGSHNLVAHLAAHAPQVVRVDIPGEGKG